ncbi:hypothetical protein EV359DRAFT_64688 [Lentinula novae-zelandiae]|nr:hypothetical protein EV359DRAFT_64688 [Lentinula novae-zelandiae]
MSTTSAPQPSGSATLSAIAVLKNPRVLEKGKKIILFDAHLFVYDDPQSSNEALMLLRYFNSEDFSFSEQGIYFVQANIARIENDISSSQLSTDLEKADYILIGDAVQLIPLNDDVDPKYRPFVNLTGVVTSSDDKNHTFEVSAKSYVSALKGHDAIMPLYCYAPDTKRWKDYPPKARINTYVGISGFLHSVRRNNGMAHCFHVELDQLTHLGRPFVPATGLKTLSSPIAGTTSSSSTKRKWFSYADSPSPTKKAHMSDCSSSSSQFSSQ